MPRISLLSVAITGLIGLGVVGGAVGLTYGAEPPCEVPAPEGKASTLVDVVDAETPDSPPLATFPTPLITKGKEITVVNRGNGVAAQPGAAVDFQVAAYLGSDGQFLTASSFVPDESVRRVVDPESDDFFSRALTCATRGDRLVVTDTIENVFGPIPEDELVQNDSTVVVVVDVVGSFLREATGSTQSLQAGAPTVVTHPEGFHGVSIPMGPPPEDLEVFRLRTGDGDALSAGQTAVVQFTGVVWETRQVFSSSFDQGIPLDVALIDGSADGSSTGVISGIFDGLVGQTIGSRVALVIPPSAGYPEGGGPPGVPEGATLVYVFDILGAK